MLRMLLTEIGAYFFECIVIVKAYSYPYTNIFLLQILYSFVSSICCCLAQFYFLLFSVLQVYAAVLSPFAKGEHLHPCYSGGVILPPSASLFIQITLQITV